MAARTGLPRSTKSGSRTKFREGRWRLNSAAAPRTSTVDHVVQCADATKNEKLIWGRSPVRAVSQDLQGQMSAGAALRELSLPRCCRTRARAGSAAAKLVQSTSLRSRRTSSEQNSRMTCRHTPQGVTASSRSLEREPRKPPKADTRGDSDRYEASVALRDGLEDGSTLSTVARR